MVSRWYLKSKIVHCARKLHCNMHDLNRFVFLQFDTTLIDILSVFFYSKTATLLLHL